jgi:asparagine synthase (glutamine-hydrolysing)
MVCKGLISFNQLLDFRKDRNQDLVYLDFDCGFFYIYERTDDERAYYPFFHNIQIGEIVLGNSASNLTNFNEDFQIYSKKSTFVAVLWNSDKRVLTLASGTFGIIPLYYYWVKNEFIAFANDIPTLLNIIPPDVKPRINEFHIHQYLSMETQSSQRYGETFYDNIKCIPPGNSVAISADTICEETFLTFDTNTYSFNKSNFSIADKLKESVFDALGNGNQIAAHLSGGLDSSAISAFAQQATVNNKIRTFYFDLETRYSDESAFVKKMLDMYGFNHTTVVPSQLILDQEIDYIKILGRPGYGVFPSIAHASVLSEAAKSKCNVLLSGHDGDSIIGFGLYDFFDELFKEDRLSELNRALEQFATVQPLDHMFTDWQKFHIEDKQRHFKRYWWSRQFDRELKSRNIIKFLKLLSRFESEQGDGFKYLKSVLYRFLKSRVTQGFTENDDKGFQLNHNVSLKTHYPYYFSGTYTDAIEGIYKTNSLDVSRDLFTLGNAYNISVRFPFLNKDLFEMSMATPLSLKFGNGIGRNHLREGLVNVLPDEVRLRMGKGSAGAYSKRAVLQLYKQGGADFLSSSSLIWHFLNKETVLKSVKSLENDTLSNMESVRFSRKMYRAMSIAIWLYSH